ncbi:hypothetical protein QYF36_021301 [Acer negundo]|nr:hypothetical protein QYF36_021301 [Acer negundo]
MALMCIIWWHVWFLRNQITHGKHAFELDSVCAWSENCMTNYRAAVDVGGNIRLGSRSMNVFWKPLPEGIFKINSDAAIDSERFVMRKWWLCLCGINLASERGLTPFVIETNALSVVNLILARTVSAVDIGMVIEEILNRLGSVLGGSVMYVPRKVNFVVM